MARVKLRGVNQKDEFVRKIKDSVRSKHFHLFSCFRVLTTNFHVIIDTHM